MATEKTKSQIVDGFMALLAEKPFSEIGLDEIALRAGVSLGQLRDAYDGKLSILADFVRRTDKAQLVGEVEANPQESARDRLFDLVMSRLDLLAPHRSALANLELSARRDPGLAVALNAIALHSARYILAAAGVRTGGVAGALRAQGFVMMMLRIVPVWRDDTDPDQSRTMAAVDRALERAEGWSRRADRAMGMACGVMRRIETRRPGRRGTAEAGPAA